jgi:hypothetical protein
VSTQVIVDGQCRVVRLAARVVEIVEKFDSCRS